MYADLVSYLVLFICGCVLLKLSGAVLNRLLEEVNSRRLKGKTYKGQYAIIWGLFLLTLIVLGCTVYYVWEVIVEIGWRFLE